MFLLLYYFTTSLLYATRYDSPFVTHIIAVIQFVGVHLHVVVHASKLYEHRTLVKSLQSQVHFNILVAGH